MNYKLTLKELDKKNLIDFVQGDIIACEKHTLTIYQISNMTYAGVITTERPKKGSIDADLPASIVRFLESKYKKEEGAKC
jgi:hypothetical protein